jgi:ribose/xylose/arabinose/galactoside ABC-type transport system permease subunit
MKGCWMADQKTDGTVARTGRHLRRHVMELILLVLCGVLAFRAEGFFSTDNLLNVLRNVSMQGVIAFGMTMVIIAGEIDLSVGSMVAFSGCLAAWLTAYLSMSPEAGPESAWKVIELPIMSAVVIAVCVSLAVGYYLGQLTGYLRVRFRVPTFISTLAWLTVLKGAAMLVTSGFPITPFPEWYNFLGGGYVGGIPFPALVFVAVFMDFTAFGRAIYAVGGNAEAARLSGIKVGRVKVKVMGIVAALAALSGIMLSSQIMSGNASVATGWELDVISAVIIGGTSLLGGSGSMWGTLTGVIFLGVLVNGMTLLNVSEFWQYVVRGVLILVAVLINNLTAEAGRGKEG